MSPTPSKLAPRRGKSDETAGAIDAQSYAAFVGDLKHKIAEARHRAALSVMRRIRMLTPISLAISFWVDSLSLKRFSMTQTYMVRRPGVRQPTGIRPAHDRQTGRLGQSETQHP